MADGISSEAGRPGSRPTGLAAIAGELDEWIELPKVVEEIYVARRDAHERDVPELD